MGTSGKQAVGVFVKPIQRKGTRIIAWLGRGNLDLLWLEVGAEWL